MEIRISYNFKDILLGRWSKKHLIVRMSEDRINLIEQTGLGSTVQLCRMKK